MCECHRVGGPFISEDPDCPVHGTASQGREERIEAIIDQVVTGELTSAIAAGRIEEDFVVGSPCTA